MFQEIIQDLLEHEGDEEEEEERCKHITQKQAKNMGFKWLDPTKPLLESRLRWNSALVEEGLQTALQHHPLGVRI